MINFICFLPCLIFFQLMLIPLWGVWITSSLHAGSMGTMVIFIEISSVPSPTRTLRDSAYQWHTSLNSIRWLEAQNKNNFLKSSGDIKCWLSALIPIPCNNSQVICCKVTFDMPHYLLKFPQNFVPAQTLLKIWNIDPSYRSISQYRILFDKQNLFDALSLKLVLFWYRALCRRCTCKLTPRVH